MGFLVCGEAVEADFMVRCWVSFELVRLWRCGACRGLRERQEAQLAGVGIPGLADGTFSRARGFPSRVRQVFVIPQSTRWQAAGRALRLIRGSGALAVS